MAITAANCWFSAVTFTGCATSCRLLSTSRRPTYLFGVRKPSNYRNQIPVKGKSPCKYAIENEVITHKFPSRSRDESPISTADGRSSRDKIGRSQSTTFKSFGVQKKGNKGILVDLKEQQVETGNLQDASFLNAVVKVYCTHTAPDYSLPWQRQRQYTSTGSAFMIGDGKLLTNAHCVEHDTQVKVKRRGDDTKYVAKVALFEIELLTAIIFL